MAGVEHDLGMAGVEPDAKGSGLPVNLTQRYIATSHQKESLSPSKKNTVLPVWGLGLFPKPLLHLPNKKLVQRPLTLRTQLDCHVPGTGDGFNLVIILRISDNSPQIPIEYIHYCT